MSCTIHPDELNVVPCSICSREICEKCAEKLFIPICSHCTEEIISQNKKELETKTPIFLDSGYLYKNPYRSEFSPEYSATSSKKALGRRFFLRWSLILCFSLLFIGSFLSGAPDLSETERVEERFQRIKPLDLVDVRHYVVSNAENDNFEKLTVFEGKVVNNFNEPRSFIELEATIYDAEGNIFEKKTQLAGPTTTPFHLQSLSESELEAALHNPMSILEYNTNIKYKESVPFMFVFYSPQEIKTSFNIEITDAYIPEVEQTKKEASKEQKRTEDNKR